MGDLGEAAERIGLDFAENYRTQRNPKGKQWIIVYGGKDNGKRAVFAQLISNKLPQGVREAEVLSQTNRLSYKANCEDFLAFYVPFGEYEALFNNSPQQSS